METYRQFLEQLKTAPVRALPGVGAVRFMDTKVHSLRPKSAYIDVAHRGNPFMPPVVSDGRIHITLLNNALGPAAPKVEDRPGSDGGYVIIVNVAKTHTRQLSRAVREVLLKESGRTIDHADDEDYPWSKLALQKLNQAPGTPPRIDLWVEPFREIF